MSNSLYLEIYGFETKNYYINICQSDSSFYYHHQSKHNAENALLIPATLLRGNVFQAISGKTKYFVGRDGNVHYSSVMQNNSEIVLEPELQLLPAVLKEPSN